MQLEALLPQLIDLLLKSAMLVLAGTVLITVLRNTSAANRHAISAAIFAALLLLPFTKVMPARWSFEMEKPAAHALNVRLPLIATAQGGSGRAALQPVENVAHPVTHALLVIPWKKLA